MIGFLILAKVTQNRNPHLGLISSYCPKMIFGDPQAFPIGG
uniref:Uncharacterized protein n=1 Tax=Anguilla anguilla TaxID=7936 RepID=A0A0E9Q1J0_ANGAN